MARTTSTSMLVVLDSGQGLDVEVSATDELDRGGEEEEESVLQGQTGDQAAVLHV